MKIFMFRHVFPAPPIGVVAALGVLALMAGLEHAHAQAPAQAPAQSQAQAQASAQDARLSARIAALEAQLARVTSTLDLVTSTPRMPDPAPTAGAPTIDAAAAAPTVAEPVGVPQPSPVVSSAVLQPLDRFTLAALNLQSVLLSGRPYQRELQAMRDLAPSDGLPPPLAEILMSHAGRGLATPSDLREGFTALAPLLIARGADNASWGDGSASMWRRVLARVGLAEPVPPPAAEATVANVIQLLARGRLAAALADIETLDPGLQPLVAGWRAQLRARIAAEQAVQETILRALGRGNPG
jgi:hypothetical protein